MQQSTQAEKAQLFKTLHVKGEPVVLYNIWDAGSAKAIAEAGAKAVATGSWSVAAAQGYSDGEAMPLEMVLEIVTRIAATVNLPVSIDFEGGYADDPETITKNVSRLIKTGAIGLNFEDQRVGSDALHEIAAQKKRIEAVRTAATNAAIPLFINARTDLFLKQSDRDKHKALLTEAKERAATYQSAGADCFFVPGLVDPELIGDICDAVSLPVNIMMMSGAPTPDSLAALGVARISYGPGPYVSAMAALAETCKNIEPVS